MHNLFQKALLDYWKAAGDQVRGQVHHDLGFYDWSITTPVGSSNILSSLFPYMCDNKNDWEIDHKTLVDEAHRIGEPCLYIGGGSGRFARYLESVGVETYCIDLAPECIELMGLRNIPCELQNGLNMSFADSSFENVIVHSDGVLDSQQDPLAMIVEASRVAEKTLLVSGYEFPNEGEIDASETHEVTTTLTWQGDSESATYYAHPVKEVEGILTNLGMRLEITKRWGQEQEDETDEQLYGLSWLIEAKW